MAVTDCIAPSTAGRHHPPAVRRRENGDIDLGELVFEHPDSLPALDAFIRAAEGEGARVRGLRWGQFLGLLQRTPLEELLDVCNHVRAVVDHGAPDPRASEGR